MSEAAPAAAPFKNPKLFGTFDKCSGINNVTAEERTNPPFVRRATNFDIDDTGELQAALGLTELNAGVWGSLWSDGTNFLGVRNGDLVRVASNGTPTALRAGVGAAAMKYQSLPNGNVVFMNGTISGTLVRGGDTVRECGVPLPASVGVAANTTGSLLPGEYQWHITHVRDGTNEEGGATFSPNMVTITTGGLALTSLPVLAGYSTNVYVSSSNDDQTYYAGNTSGSSLTITAFNDQLVVPARTEFMAPPPVGTALGFFRGRLLVAVGNVLFASRPFQYELFDYRQDYKQFPAAIRFVAAVTDGIYVGTAEGVWFLSGETFDKMHTRQVDTGEALANSDVVVDRSVLGTDERIGEGAAIVAVVGQAICVGYNGGSWSRVTDGVYHLPPTAVCTGASYRLVRGINQYVLHTA